MFFFLFCSQNSVIHGFIPAARSGHYRPGLRSGSVVKVSRFEVARCTKMYKITDNPFVIWFLPQTTIDEVLVNAPIINLQKFMLRKFEHLQALANTNLELPGLFLIYYSRNNFIHFKNCLNYGLRLRQYMCFTLQML